MEKVRYLSGDFSEKLVYQLKQYGIKADIGWNYQIEIHDEGLFFQIEDLLRRDNIYYRTQAIFTDEEYKNAEYGVKTAMHTCGYPKPDHDFGYMNLTYDLTNYCDKCGCGAVQKDAFRISKIAKHKMFVLGWVFDELFVHKDVYETIFKPLGIECREVRRYWQEYIIDSIVQLVLPETVEPLSFPKAFEAEVCPQCHIPKYTPHIVDFYPLHKNPIAPIYKGAEYFGSGYEARKKIYVSAELRDILIKNKIAKLYFFTPCKNP